MISSALSQWEASGQYISLEPFKIKVFVKQMGNPQATPDKTLLLLHGFPESSFSYHAVLDGLAATFDRIILFDFPGFGWSDKPLDTYTYSLFEHADVAFAVWKHFGIQGGHLLAHDMGVSVATEILARNEQALLPAWFSEGLQSLTLTNGSIVFALAKLRITQKILLSKIGRQFNKLTTFRLFKQQVISAHGNAKLSDAIIQSCWDANTLQHGHRKFYLTVRYNLERMRFEKARWLPALSQTQVPVHICWGEQDAVARVAMAHYIKDKICPQATLTIMKNLGHFGQMASPKAWNEAVIGYYRNHGSSSIEI